MNIRYWRAPTNYLNHIGSKWEASIDLDKGEPTTIDVLIDLYYDMLVFLKRSAMNSCCERSKSVGGRNLNSKKVYVMVQDHKCKT